MGTVQSRGTLAHGCARLVERLGAEQPAEGAGGMAYRFLLEVPKSLAEAANLAVDQLDDAQVVVSRDSHGLGVDNPYKDMTVAAHSLRVVDVLYAWYGSLREPRPEVRIVLHGGERHSLGKLNSGQVVSLIRRDQPWVERSIPHVGDHEPSSERAGYSIGVGAPALPAASAQALRSAIAVADAEAEADASAVTIRAINYVLVQVNDLAKAERFYPEFFGMTLDGRLRRGPDGTLAPLPRDYSWERALQTGELAEMTFFSNGPLTIAAQSVGLGVLLSKGPLELVSVGVDARTFARIKGVALMRPLTVLRSSTASFVFRDPLGVNWEIAVVGSVPLIPV